MTDKESNKPRGYAFIEYVHTRDMKGILAPPVSSFFLPFTFSYNCCVCVMQLHINKRMGKRLITGGCWWMSNVVEPSQIGDLEGLVVDLELLELAVKMLTRGNWGGNSSYILSVLALPGQQSLGS